MDTQTIQQTTQQTAAVSAGKKNTNTLMLVLAGVGTGIGYVLSGAIANAVYSIVSNSIEMNSFASIQMVSNLSPIITFFIRVIILLICAVITFKKTSTLINFFACCISGQTIASFIGNVINTIIFSVFYIKNIELFVTAYSKITLVVQVLCGIFSALFAVVLLISVTSKEKSQAFPTYAGDNIQNETEFTTEQPLKSPKSRGAAVALCIFFGTLGIHRFYTGKVGTAILWMLTGGLFGIGAIVDFFMLLFGTFKDSDGLKLS